MRFNHVLTRARCCTLTARTAAAGSLLTVLLLPAVPAQATPDPSTPPLSAARAKGIADEIGDDRTGGVFYNKAGQLTVAVTDRAAAESVRAAGGTPKLVGHSTRELASAHAKLDKLAGIPNTSWGIDPSSNQVVVEIYDDVSAADEARIRRVAAAQGDAVRVEQRGGTLQRTYDVRGGIGIHNDSYVCSAGFNVTNSAGKRYLLTAGHCMTGGTTWYRRNGSIYLGVRSGDFDNGEDDTGDWGLIEYKNPDVRALGMVQYKDGSSSQITRSRYVTDGETAKRVGTMTQDLVGMVLQPVTTVTYDDGTTLTNMIKTSHCSVNGDSGGPLFAGDAALGLVSGGNYVKQPCGDSDGQSDRVSWHTPVQRVLDVEHPELSVY